MGIGGANGCALRLWLSIVFRFGLFGWVSGIRSAGFTFVKCTTYVTRIITII